jgi:hypothetical protein
VYVDKVVDTCPLCGHTEIEEEEEECDSMHYKRPQVATFSE